MVVGGYTWIWVVIHGFKWLRMVRMVMHGYRWL